MGQGAAQVRVPRPSFPLGTNIFGRVEEASHLEKLWGAAVGFVTQAEARDATGTGKTDLSIWSDAGDEAPPAIDQGITVRLKL